MEKQDQMRARFQTQKTLDEHIDIEIEGMSEEEKTRWILDQCRAMTQEIAELADSAHWKSRARCQKVHMQRARVEADDLIRCLLSSPRFWA
jgi:dUTPase